jgi:hypothetical protein
LDRRFCSAGRRRDRVRIILMAQPRHPPGPPMDLANMSEQGVHHLIAYCLNDSCHHQAIIDMSSYPGDTPVKWFGTKVKCAKCNAQ